MGNVASDQEPPSVKPIGWKNACASVLALTVSYIKFALNSCFLQACSGLMILSKCVHMYTCSCVHMHMLGSYGNRKLFVCIDYNNYYNYI